VRVGAASACGVSNLDVGIRLARIERALHPLNTTMSYFSVDGLVSGIKSHMIEAASKPTDAILRNVAAQSKFAAASPKSAVLSAAPSPDAVPTMP
jgi:hypothetical protein